MLIVTSSNLSFTIGKVRSFDPSVMGPNEEFPWLRDFVFERICISNGTKLEYVEGAMYKCETLDDLVSK